MEKKLNRKKWEEKNKRFPRLDNNLGLRKNISINCSFFKFPVKLEFYHDKLKSNKMARKIVYWMLSSSTQAWFEVLKIACWFRLDGFLLFEPLTELKRFCRRKTKIYWEEKCIDWFQSEAYLNSKKLFFKGWGKTSPVLKKGRKNLMKENLFIETNFTS